jgi:HEAT repeat protein
MIGRRHRLRELLPALFWLAACAPAHDAQDLFSQMQSPDPEVRQDAQAKITRILESGEHEVFLRGARTLHGAGRVQSILYLARFRQPEARAALRSLLREDQRALVPWNPIRMKPQSEETDSRIMVAHLITVEGGDPEAAAVLLEGAERQTPEILIGTLYALGALRDPQAVPLLTRSLRHESMEVARAAVEALARIKDAAAFEALASVADHPLPTVRSDVLSALELREEPAAADLLRRIAGSDPSVEIRVNALRQMYRYHDAVTVEFLIARLGGGAPEEREAAHATLLQITGQNFGPRAPLWTRWWSANAATFAGSGGG